MRGNAPCADRLFRLKQRLQNQRLGDAFGFLHLGGNFLLDSLFLGGDGGEPVFLALQRIEVVAAQIGA